MSHRLYMMVHGGLLMLVFFAVTINSIEEGSEDSEECANDDCF